MIRRAPLLGLLILFAAVLGASAVNYSWSSLRRAVLPTEGLHAMPPPPPTPIESDGDWKVLFLECPIMKEELGPRVGNLAKAYHSGIGFVNEETGEEFCVDFAAKQFSKEGILPTIEDGELFYQKESEARMYENLQPWEDRWDILTPIGRADEEVVLKFKKWFGDFQKNPPEYQLFGLRENDEIVVKSNTCYDFCFAAIDKLYEMGAQIDKPEKKRVVTAFDILPGSIHTAEKADELAFWTKVYKITDFKSLTFGEKLGAIRKAFVHATHKNPITYYYTFKGKTSSFQLSPKRFFNQYMEEAIPSKEAVALRRSNMGGGPRRAGPSSMGSSEDALPDGVGSPSENAAMARIYKLLKHTRESMLDHEMTRARLLTALQLMLASAAGAMIRNAALTHDLPGEIASP